MNLDIFWIYNILLWIWVLWLFVIACIILSNQHIKQKITQNIYYLFISVISGASIIWALIYEYVFDLAPCYYCWTERIFLFPLFLIALISYVKKIEKNYLIIWVFWILWFLLTLYHTYLQYSSMFEWKEVNSACSLTWPSCIWNDWVAVFGVLTIPAMWVLTFLSILIFTKIVYKKNHK